MSSATPSLEDVFEQCCDMDASLAERLATFAEAVRTQRPAFSDAVERLVRRLRESGIGEAAPKPGDLMPPFLLPDEAGQLVSLEDLLRQAPLPSRFIGAIGAPTAGSTSMLLLRHTTSLSAMARKSWQSSPSGSNT